MIRISYLLLPFAYISFGTIYRGQQHFLLICAFLLTACKIKNIVLNSFFFYVAGWVLWIMLSNMLAGKSNIESAEAFSTIVYFWIAAAIILAVSESTISISKIINVLCIMAIIQATMAISQRLGFDPFYWLTSQFFEMRRDLADNTLTGSLGNPNYLAGFLAISLPFFFRKYWAWFIPLLCAVFYLSSTSTAIIAASAAVIVYYRTYKLAIPLLLIAIIYILFIDWNGPIIYKNIRWTWWGNITTQTMSTWQTAIFGFGPGAGWGHTFPMHNEWVAMFYQFGAVGLGFAMLYIIHIPLPNKISSTEYKMLFAALVAAAVNCIGNHPLHLAPSAFLILIVMGLIERKTR